MGVLHPFSCPVSEVRLPQVRRCPRAGQPREGWPLGQLLRLRSFPADPGAESEPRAGRPALGSDALWPRRPLAREEKGRKGGLLLGFF